MDIKQLLYLISELAAKNNISRPYIVGGIPRDRIIKQSKGKLHDLDITVGNEGSIVLGEMTAKALQVNPKKFDDGHVMIKYGGIQIDFSNNFTIPGIESILVKMGVKNITPMKKEIYSRDFTINTLLEDFTLTNIYDVTQYGVDDIVNKIIRCPIDPNITIGYDPRRILRAIKFAIKFGFDIEESLSQVMFERRWQIKDLAPNFVSQKVSDIVKIDEDKGLEILDKYKLLSLAPLTKRVSDALIRRRQLAKVFD